MRNTFDRFNGRHQDYQAARPSYAQEFLDWLGELYAPPERYTAADIGSGTGKLSAQLLAAGFRVCGVEPNPDSAGGRRRRFWAAIPGSPPQMERTMIPAAGPVRGHGRSGPGLPLVRRSCLCAGVPPDPASRRAGRSRLERPRVCTDEPGLGPGLSGALPELSRIHRRDGGGRPRIRDFFGGAYEKRRFPNPLTLDRDRFLRRCFSSSYACGRETRITKPFGRRWRRCSTLSPPAGN